MDKRFYLAPAARCPVTVLDDIPFVRLQIWEREVLKDVKKRARVAAGALLAVHASPNQGDMHAPFDGVIKDVTGAYIEIEAESPPAPVPTAEGGEGKAARPPSSLEKKAEPRSFDGLDPIALAASLKELGISVRPFTHECDLFIINGLNPEPGMLYAQELLSEHMPVLEAGFKLLQRLNKASKFLLALPEGSDFTLEGASSVKLSPVYPNSLAHPLIRAVIGSEDTRRVALARLHALFQLGLVAQSGLPLTHTVTTAFGCNFFLPLGTPIATLLERAGYEHGPGDTVILGGAMRGVAISGLRRGVRKVDDAVLLIKKNMLPTLADNPCVNCGTCVSICPMRLRPNMLSRYSEFKLYDHCLKEHLETCIECGMCGYVCPSCRPMQQHLRMAKHNLGLSTLQHRLR